MHTAVTAVLVAEDVLKNNKVKLRFRTRFRTDWLKESIYGLLFPFE